MAELTKVIQRQGLDMCVTALVIESFALLHKLKRSLRLSNLSFYFLCFIDLKANAFSGYYLLLLSLSTDIQYLY